MLLHLEAQHIAVEGLRPVEVGNLEVDVADRGAGRDRVVAHRRKVSQMPRTDAPVVPSNG